MRLMRQVTTATPAARRRAFRDGMQRAEQSVADGRVVFKAGRRDATANLCAAHGLVGGAPAGRTAPPVCRCWREPTQRRSTALGTQRTVIAMTVKSRGRNLCAKSCRSADRPLKFRQDGAQPVRSDTLMIRFGHQIRLTHREVERFTKITAIEPGDVRSLADLDAYIARCKAHYWGSSRDTQFLHWLIDQEYGRCREAA